MEMYVHGYPVDKTRGFKLVCGKLEPIEFIGNDTYEMYKRAKERQRYEKTKNRRNYMMIYHLDRSNTQ